MIHNGSFSFTEKFHLKSVFLFDLMLIQVHGQILVHSFNWIFFARVNSDKKISLWHTKTTTELKHAVVHHVEKTEYTME